MIKYQTTKLRYLSKDQTSENNNKNNKQGGNIYIGLAGSIQLFSLFYPVFLPEYGKEFGMHVV
jgi:hypothetical protein